MLGVLCVCCVILVGLFIKWQCHVKNPSTCSYTISNKDMNSKWIEYKSYFSLLLLEGPRRTIKFTGILSHIWERWRSDQYVQVKGQNLTLPHSKQEKFREYINTNTTRKFKSNQVFENNKTELDIKYQQMISYYSILIGKLQLLAFSKAKFPLPILGAVHMSNEFEVFCELDEKNSFDIDLKVHHFSKHNSGILFQVESIITQENKPIWKCVSTFLSKIQVPVKEIQKDNKFSDNMSVSSKKTLTESMIDSFGSEDDFSEMQFPDNMGKEFASICGDYNPIHTNKTLAKLFGLRKCIAHGICAFAKAFAQVPFHLVPVSSKYPLKASIYFVYPIFIPSTAYLKYCSTVPNQQSNKNSKEAIYLTLRNEENKTCLFAIIENIQKCEE